MGEARRRGTREARVAQAQARAEDGRRRLMEEGVKRNDAIITAPRRKHHPSALPALLAVAGLGAFRGRACD